VVPRRPAMERGHKSTLQSLPHLFLFTLVHSDGWARVELARLLRREPLKWFTKGSSARRSSAQQAMLLRALTSQWAPHLLDPKDRRMPYLTPPFAPYFLFVPICRPFSCSFPDYSLRTFPYLRSDRLFMIRDSIVPPDPCTPLVGFLSILYRWY
jgi:hypothetical protein